MDKQSIFDAVQQIFRDNFDDEELVITRETCADDIEDWDSLEHINLVVAVEKEFGMKFTMGEVTGMANVGEMVDILMQRATK